MFQLKTLRVLEEEFGLLAKSGLFGETVYYKVSWEELRQAAKEAAQVKNKSWPEDVRSAGWALDLVGIPNQHVRR